MKSLKEYIVESADNVYAVKDNTGAILNIFNTKEEAEADLKNWPTESAVKVVTVKRNEVEN